MSEYLARLDRAEIYAAEHDLLCDCHIDYLDCMECQPPQHIIEEANDY